MFCPGKGLYSQQHGISFLKKLAWVNAMWHHHPSPQQTNNYSVLNSCRFWLIISSFLSFNWLSVLAAVPQSLKHYFSSQHEHHKRKLSSPRNDFQGASHFKINPILENLTLYLFPFERMCSLLDIKELKYKKIGILTGVKRAQQLTAPLLRK